MRPKYVRLTFSSALSECSHLEIHVGRKIPLPSLLCIFRLFYFWDYRQLCISRILVLFGLEKE